MKFQEILSVEKLQDLTKKLNYEGLVGNLLSQGYSTGEIELPTLGLAFELLPNQFYRHHGYVKSIPHPNHEEKALGLCSNKFNNENGIRTIDIFILQGLYPLTDLLVQGHEEGHTCFHFGKLTDVYDAMKNVGDKRFGNLIGEYLIDREYIEYIDKITLLQDLVCILKEDESPENTEQTRGLLENFFDIHKKQIHQQIEGICGLCGTYAALKKGYNLMDIL